MGNGVDVDVDVNQRSSHDTPAGGITPPQGTKVKVNLPEAAQPAPVKVLDVYSVIQNVDLSRAASGLSDARYISGQSLEREIFGRLSEKERAEAVYLLRRDNYCLIPQEGGHDCLVFRLNGVCRGGDDWKVINPPTVNPVEWSGYALDRKTTVVGVLGAGANGVVLLAYEKGLDLFRAVKALKDYNSLKQSERDQLEREAKILCRFDNANIVKALGLVSVNVRGQPVYCMIQEYCPGDTYSKYIEGLFDGSQRRGGAEVIGGIFQFHKFILDGLAYAHEYREPVTNNSIPIIHRDVKPDNIKITVNNKGEENVKILDFGIGRFGERLLQEEQDNRLSFSLASNFLGSHNTTQAGDEGRLKGTPFYAAPEQFMGDSTKAVDVYGATLTFYEGLTGINPFKLDNALYKTHFGFEALKRIGGKSYHSGSDEQLLSFIKESDRHIESRSVPNLSVITERTADVVGVVKQMLERAEENNNFDNLSERYKRIIGKYVNEQVGEDGHLRHCFEVVLGNKGDFFEKLIEQVNAGNVSAEIARLDNIEELYRGLSREFSKRPELQAIMEKGLAIDYKKRYQSAREALDDFDRYVKGDRVKAYEEKLGEQASGNRLLRVVSGVIKPVVEFVPAALGYVPEWLVGYKSPNEKAQIIARSRWTTAVATALSTLWLSFRGVSESYAVENARGNITRSVGNLLGFSGQGIQARYYEYQQIDHSVTEILRTLSEVKTAAREVESVWFSRLWNPKPALLQRHAELIANFKDSLQDYLEFNKDPNKTPMRALTIDCSPKTGFDLNEWCDRCITKLRKIMQICRNLGACEQAGVFEGLSEEGQAAFENLKKSLAEEYHDTRLVGTVIEGIGKRTLVDDYEPVTTTRHSDYKRLSFKNKFLDEKEPPPYLDVPFTQDQQKFVDIINLYDQLEKSKQLIPFEDILNKHQFHTIQNPNLRLCLAITLAFLDGNYHYAFKIIENAKAINNNPLFFMLETYAQLDIGDVPNALRSLQASIIKGGQKNMEYFKLLIDVTSIELSNDNLSPATSSRYEQDLKEALKRYEDFLLSTYQNPVTREVEMTYINLFIRYRMGKFDDAIRMFDDFNKKYGILPENQYSAIPEIFSSHTLARHFYIKRLALFAQLKRYGPSPELERSVREYLELIKTTDKITLAIKLCCFYDIACYYALSAQYSYKNGDQQQFEQSVDKAIAILKEYVLRLSSEHINKLLNDEDILWLYNNNSKFKQFIDQIFATLNRQNDSSTTTSRE